MLQRRLITIPAYVLAWSFWVATAPLWCTLALVVDLLRGSRGVALRSAGFVTVYLTCEVVGIAASGLLWAWRSGGRVDPDRWQDLHFRLEAWWGSTIFRALVVVFGLRVEVEGGEALGAGPYLLILRHASSGDALLAPALVSRPHGIRLRYVLKQELLWDPCLDIVGNRLPNVFMDRSSDDPSLQVSRIRDLARDLGPRDGILIYPEGTRFSEDRRRCVLQRYEEQRDEKMLEYTRSLACVLPPRPGGTIAALEAAPDADVVICSHTGFEGAASLGRVWNGALLHGLIRLEFRRIPRDRIPAEREAVVSWLLEEWKRVDAWVESHAAA